MLLIWIYDLQQKTDIVHSYTAVVSSYYYYKQFWKPIKNEELHCLHEKLNFYDSFAAKNYARVVRLGNLSREISWVKTFLDRWVSVYVKLSSRHDRRSTLVRP